MERCALISAVVLCLCAFGHPATAQDSEEAQKVEAQKLVEAGLKDARAKRFEAAAERFVEALKLYPHPEIAHNLARAQQELGQLVDAIGSFKRALEMDATYTYAEDARTRISALDAELKKTHGVLTIRSTPDGVGITIFVDGVPFAQHLTTPVTRYVPAGPYVVRGVRPGFMDGEQGGQIAAGADEAIDMLLKPTPKKGFLTITSDVQGAEIYLDDVRVGVTPLEGHPVAAGQHAVRVTSEGRTD
ncbi:MAG: PEGA domain-containing protein, partial [Myxococcota bacterium]|nr:PEGA domain-containing protein [Myxococcota bacterium]